MFSMFLFLTNAGGDEHCGTYNGRTVIVAAENYDDALTLVTGSGPPETIHYPDGSKSYPNDSRSNDWDSIKVLPGTCVSAVSGIVFDSWKE